MKKIRTIMLVLLIMSTVWAGGMAIPAEDGHVYANTISFSDVQNSQQWYYTYVYDLAGKGIINGYEDGTFQPERYVTYGEALKLILQTKGIQIENLSTPEELFAYWGSDIIATAEKHGIIARGSIIGSQPAPRGKIGEFIVKTMGWENASHIQGVFIDTDDDYAEILYQKGIVTGIAGEKGYSYAPESFVKRSEISALIYRINNYKPLEIKAVLRGAEAALVTNPVTKEDFKKIYLYMADKNLMEYTINYTGNIMSYDYDKREEICNNAVNTLKEVFSTYHEYYCYISSVSVDGKVRNGVFQLKIDLSNKNFNDEEIKGYRAMSFDLAKGHLQNMISNGLITEEMSDEEKAMAIYRWVSANCRYDKNFGKISYFGYGAAKDGLAVCQGYTALYNTMCKMMGIYCQGVIGESTSGGKTEEHIWTKANLNGRDVYIDVTFGDTGAIDEDDCDMKYFAVPVNQLWSSHKEI